MSTVFRLTSARFVIIDDIPKPQPEKPMYNDPTLTPIEVTRLRRMQKELKELEERLDAKTRDEWCPSSPDAESMFLLSSITSARKDVDLALEHHRLYREPQIPIIDWDVYSEVFNRRMDELIYKDLFQTVYGRPIYKDDNNEE